MKILATLTAICMTLSLTAQSAVGTWKTIDDEDGKVKSHITIQEVDGKLVGTIAELIDPERTTCSACKGDKKDKPLIGMEILWDLNKTGDGQWAEGQIMDPKNGKTYKCKMELNGDNELQVRGFIGFSLLGRTQTWYRID